MPVDLWLDEPKESAQHPPLNFATSGSVFGPTISGIRSLLFRFPLQYPIKRLINIRCFSRAFTLAYLQEPYKGKSGIGWGFPIYCILNFTSERYKFSAHWNGRVKKKTRRPEPHCWYAHKASLYKILLGPKNRGFEFWHHMKSFSLRKPSFSVLSFKALKGPT